MTVEKETFPLATTRLPSGSSAEEEEEVLEEEEEEDEDGVPSQDPSNKGNVKRRIVFFMAIL